MKINDWIVLILMLGIMLLSAFNIIPIEVFFILWHLVWVMYFVRTNINQKNKLIGGMMND